MPPTWLVVSAAIPVAACGLSVVGEGATNGVDGGSSSSSSSSSGASSGSIGDGGLDGSSSGPGSVFSCNDQLTESVFVDNQSGARGVAIIGSDLWWTREGAGELKKMPLAGGTIDTMSTPTISPTDISGVGTDIFFTDRAAKTIYRWTGFTAQSFQTGQVTATGISVSGTNVYWARQQEDSVGYVGIAEAGGSVVIQGAQNYPGDVFVVGNTMYFSCSSGIVSSKVGADTPQTILSPTNRFKDGGGDLIHNSLAVVNDSIVFTISSLGIVACVPTTGGVARVLSRNQDGPEGIAATPTAVYWANGGSGKIMRLAR